MKRFLQNESARAWSKGLIIALVAVVVIDGSPRSRQGEYPLLRYQRQADHRSGS